MMLKLFSEENEDYQVRDERQKKLNGELNNCDLRLSKYDDEDAK